MAEFAHDAVVPFRESAAGKKEQVEGMFDQIAPRYDFLNRLLSARIDLLWRKKAIAMLPSSARCKLLDLATGTADMAIMAAKRFPGMRITGADISAGMLALGRKKVEKEQLKGRIELLQADSASLPFNEGSFDACTIAFGVRNFENLQKGISEMHRVLNRGGKLIVLEFSRPKTKLIRKLYDVYMQRIASRVGRYFTNNACAYEYLEESVRKFPEGQAFTEILTRCGFKDATVKPMTFGVCSIYCATK